MLSRSWMKGTFRFGHSSTIHPFQTLLGLYKDEVPLRSDNYAFQKLHRKFRSDRNVPKATGITMVLYSCDTNTSWSNEAPPGVTWPQTLQPYMIQMLVRELPEKFPFCNTHFCDYKSVREHYDQYITHCDQEKLCSLGTGHSFSDTSTVYHNSFITTLLMTIMFMSLLN